MTTVRKFTEKDKSVLALALTATAVIKSNENSSQNEKDKVIRQQRLKFQNYLKAEQLSHNRAERQAKKPSRHSIFTPLQVIFSLRMV
jgi:hypothetical protein